MNRNINQIDESTPSYHARLPRSASVVNGGGGGTVRNSTVSLSSNQESDFRFSTIFARIGVYKGRIYAVKKSVRPIVDINRKLKKELKVA